MFYHIGARKEGRKRKKESSGLVADQSDIVEATLNEKWKSRKTSKCVGDSPNKCTRPLADLNSLKNKKEASNPNQKTDKASEESSKFDELADSGTRQAADGPSVPDVRHGDVGATEDEPLLVPCLADREDTTIGQPNSTLSQRFDVGSEELPDDHALENQSTPETFRLAECDSSKYKNIASGAKTGCWLNLVLQETETAELCDEDKSNDHDLVSMLSNLFFPSSPRLRKVFESI